MAKLPTINGKVASNPQIVRSMYKQLSLMKNPPIGTPKDEADALRLEQIRICGGESNEPQVMAWLEHISKIEDDAMAQAEITKTLLPMR